MHGDAVAQAANVSVKQICNGVVDSGEARQVCVSGCHSASAAVERPLPSLGADDTVGTTSGQAKARETTIRKRDARRARLVLLSRCGEVFPVGVLSSIREMESPPLTERPRKGTRDSNIATYCRPLNVPSHQFAAGGLRECGTKPEESITRHHAIGWVRPTAYDGPSQKSVFHHGQPPRIDQLLGIVCTEHNFV
jgi:hypothetical protein